MMALAAGMNIEAARRAVAAILRANDIESPQLEARILVGIGLDLDSAGMALEPNRVLAAPEISRLSELLTRRIAGEPIARIRGEKEFWGLSFRLSRETLVPRPATETLIEAALSALDHEKRRHDLLRIADLGTGSGALLIALLYECPNAVGIGTDLSLAALACARDNAEALGVGDRAHFVATHFAAALQGKFDVIVSNPPYICFDDIVGLPISVRNHDPLLALDGGVDGLRAYRQIAAVLPPLLAPGGLAIVELGAGQEPFVAEILGKQGLTFTPARRDVDGIPRALMLRHP